MNTPGHFRSNPQHTAYTDDPGPSNGEITWKTPLGRQWYSPPLVRDDRVFVVSPGRKGRKLLAVDLSNGETVWESVGTREPAAGALPARMRLSSAIVDAGSSLYVRPLDHDTIYGIDPTDGSVADTIPDAGSLDYRTHQQPLIAGDDRWLLYPAGTGAGTGPSTGQIDPRIWHTLVCYDLERAETSWRFQIGQFFCAPVISGEFVYVGTAEGYVYALRLEPPAVEADGLGIASVARIAWSFKAGASVNGGIEVHGGTVFFGANDGVIYAVDAESGSERWRTHVGEPESHSFVQFSRPLVAHGVLYTGSAGAELLALDLATGNVLSRNPAADWVRARPAAADDAVVIASMDGTVACMDSADLSARWERTINRWHLTCDPVIAGDRLLVITSDMTLHCLRLDGGSTIWSRAIVEYPEDYVAFDEYQSSPTVADGTVYVGTPGHFIAAIDAVSGVERWKYEVGGEVPADPIVADGRVFCGQQGGEGRYFCLDASTGDVVWEQHLGRVWAGSNLVDGLLYVPGAEGVAWCLKADDGTIVWRRALSSDLYVAPLIWDDNVGFGSWDEWFYTFDRHTGELRWRFHAETFLDSSASLYFDESIYVPTMGPRFFCLDAATGAERWRYVPDPIWTTNASPAVSGDRLIVTVFLAGGMPWKPYTIHTRCLDRHTGEEIWSFPSGGLNGATIAGDRVYFASTARGDHGFYCVDLAGNGDGTTNQHFRVELGFTTLESCVAISGERAYVYAEDGYLYAID